MCQSVSFSQHSAALLEVSRKTDFPPYEAPSYFSAVNSADSAGEGRQQRGSLLPSWRRWEQIWAPKGQEDQKGVSRIPGGGTPMCKDMKYK